MRIFVAILLTASAVLAGCAEKPSDPTPTTASSTRIPVDDAGSTPERPGYPMREDTKSFTLPPKGSIEWKFRLDEGSRFEYSWSASRPVSFDFHGDFDDGTDEFVSHKKATLASDSDAFTIPFYGRHGWYFANTGPQTLTIELHTKGPYEVIGRTGGNTAG